MQDARRAAVQQARRSRRRARRRVARGRSRRWDGVGAAGLAGLGCTPPGLVRRAVAAIAGTWRPCRRWPERRSWRPAQPLTARWHAPTSAALSRSLAPIALGIGIGRYPQRRPRRRGHDHAGDWRRAAHRLAAAAVEPDRHPHAAVARARHFAALRRPHRGRGRRSRRRAGLDRQRRQDARLRHPASCRGRRLQPLQGRAEAVAATSCVSAAPPCGLPASRRPSASRPAAPATGATAAGRRRGPRSAGSSTAAR